MINNILLDQMEYIYFFVNQSLDLLADEVGVIFTKPGMRSSWCNFMRELPLQCTIILSQLGITLSSCWAKAARRRCRFLPLKVSLESLCVCLIQHLSKIVEYMK